jgi:hypothetical protein
MVLSQGAFAAAQRDAEAPPQHRGFMDRVFISPAGEPYRAQGETSALAVWFAKADADHDGFVDAREMAADHMRFFHELDQNHDGVIAGPEVTRYEQEIAPEILAAIDQARSEMRAGRGEGGGERRGGGMRGGGHGRRGGGGWGGGGAWGGGAGGQALTGAGRFGLLDEPEPIQAADADLDYRITEAEWSAMALGRLKRLDADGDGKLGLAELQAQRPKPPTGRHRRGGREDAAAEP